jgi:Tol biopolymer transport system component/DNA-binding winged helix-turn-helix (wHTH) protein
LEANRYRFGPYELRIRTRELYKLGTRLKLRPQPFQVLQALLEKAGDAVTRQEFRQRLWPADTFVDFERGLNTSIKELRRVLCDSAAEPRYIQTLPRIGYRIVAPVEAELASDVPANGREPAEEIVPASPTQPHLILRPRPVFLYIAAAVLLPAVLVGWMIVGGHPAPHPSMPVPLTSFRGSAQLASWSPDGRQLAFVWNGERQERFDVYVGQPGSSQSLRLTTGPGDNLSPAWSPDAKWIAYVHSESRWGKSSLQLVSPLGGLPQTVLTSESAMGRISWLPGGRAMVLEIRPQPQQPVLLWVVWIDGSHRPLTVPPKGIPGDTAPAVSPDGRTVAFCRATFWRTSELYVLNLKPDLTPAGPPRRVTNLGSARWPAWTPDGKRIVFDGDCDAAGLCQVDIDGGRPQPVFGAPPTASQPALARRPEGYTSLVFANMAAETSVWRYGTEASANNAPVELAPSSGSQRSPRYSPDGRRLAFASDRTG